MFVCFICCLHGAECCDKWKVYLQLSHDSLLLRTCLYYKDIFNSCVNYRMK